MASAAKWLEELGVPPREVCLDWAWQIHAQIQSPPRENASAPEPLAWDKIEVVDAGRIELEVAARVHSPDALLRQLVQWAGLPSPDVEPRAFDSKFAALGAAELLNELRRSTLATCTAAPSGEELQHGGHLSTGTEGEGRVTILVERQRTRKSRRRGDWLSPAIALVKQHRLAVSLTTSGLLLVAAGWIAWSHNAENAGARKLAAWPPKLAADAANDDPAPAAPLETAHSPAAERLLDEPLVELPKFGEVAAQEPWLTPLAMPQFAAAELAGMTQPEQNRPEAFAGDAAVATPIAQGSTPETLEKTLASSRPSGADAQAEVSDGSLSPLNDQDVLKEVAGLAKSAEAKTTESELAAPLSQNASSILEPLVIPTFPMIQTQKLPAQGGQRLRQPVWHMQLSVDPEFEVTPLGPQRISNRQLTTWFISNAGSQPPRTWMMVQAQAAPGRQTALRWRIGSGAEDLPNMILPLSKEILPPLQQRLRDYSQAAQQESDRLKQQARDAEKDLRSAMTKQGKSLEAQSKLASRVASIAAESQLLNDLLRSQITVYAELRDGEAADAPLVLQFGDPKNLASQTDEEPSP